MGAHYISQRGEKSVKLGFGSIATAMLLKAPIKPTVACGVLRGSTLLRNSLDRSAKKVDTKASSAMHTHATKPAQSFHEPMLLVWAERRQLRWPSHDTISSNAEEPSGGSSVGLPKQHRCVSCAAGRHHRVNSTKIELWSDLLVCHTPVMKPIPGGLTAQTSTFFKCSDYLKTAKVEILHFRMAQICVGINGGGPRL